MSKKRFNKSGHRGGLRSGIVHRMISLTLCAGLFLTFFAGSWTDIFRSVPEQAGKAYTEDKFEKALELYQEAQTRNPDSDTLAYNLGNTLYKLGRFDEAAGQYGKILEKESPALTPRAVYNMGNTLFQMGRQNQNQEFLKQALEAYKQSVVLDPDDEDPKYNYELTRRLIKEQEQKQQQQNQQDQQDQKKDDKQQQQQQNQQQKEQKEKQENEQQQQKQEQKQQQEEQQAQQQPVKMTKEEAERILDALMQMEKEMQQKEKEKKRAAARSRGPDW